ncbi:MAG: acetyl-CoA carboxylase biotin carboxyl carrier protein subunit [Dehalococcoidia bacterium]
MAQKFLVNIGGDDVTYELSSEDGRVRVRRGDDGAWLAVDLERVGESGLHVLMIDNRPTEIYLERRRGGALATIGRHSFECAVAPWRPGQRAKSRAGASGLVRIVAPMTGSIVEVRVSEGDQVTKGQVVLVIESMKMNNELRSPADGVVESVPVVAGQKVLANELLVAVKAGGA